MKNTIKYLFEEAVQKYPNNLAVKYLDQTLTYDELNNRANQLAYNLISKGVKPETIVAISFERSIDLIVAIWGVIKTGAAYLPIDPNFPSERIEYMVANSEALYFITNSELPIRTSHLENKILYLDKFNFIDKKFENPAVRVDEDNLIYVIYTSGSTGKPKGVMIENHSLVNRLLWMQKEFPIGPGDLILQKTNISFDVSVWELIWWSLYGAGLVLLEPGAEKEPAKILRAIHSEKVSVIHFVPSMLNLFLDYIELRKVQINHHFNTLKYFFSSGEALKVQQVKKFNELFKSLPGVKLINLYGPTEAAIDASYFVCPRENNFNTIPIGKAIDNIKLHIYRENVPATIGEIGELFISGVGLARGYVNNIKLTEERFISDAFSTNVRMYRTGDLVRMLPDGNIEYLGREDFQIKIRGFRIEIEEIENNIRKLNFVKDCIVKAHKLSEENIILIAYVVSDSDFSEKKVKDYLREFLPDYMIPTHFVRIDKIPLTPNGKADLKSLPFPSIKSKSINTISNTHQLSDIENQVYDIWKEILSINEISFDDNFFDLGGNSLLMGRLQLELNKKFNLDIPIIDLFNYSTIESISKHISYLKNSEILISSEHQKTKNRIGVTDIAIIGIAGRYPKARNIQVFWENLINGVEVISFFNDNELEILPNDNPDSELKFVKARGVLEDADKFDAEFFGFNPREASIMDPQHRVFLECCYNALEDAGYVPEKFDGSIGIFAGSSLNTYLIYNILSDRNKQEEFANSYQIADYTTLTGNDNGFLTTKVAYKLGLNGPAVNIQTACSTSLVAVGEAYKSLVTGECDMALAGGVSISFPQKRGYYFVDGSIGSVDGHCKPFDESATGTVFSAGSGVVVLKRLEDAVRDGDSVYAVIKSVALNNDGSEKAGYMAPSIDGQKEAILRAQKMADVNPETIRYIETHGTGTPVGDPIELTALEKAFRLSTDKKQFCGIGSVKSNVGHTDAAAGITGLIKTALALKHRTIPPTIHFQKPNPRFDFVKSPFYVVDRVTKFPEDIKPVRAAVSAFGVGGTNAHAILEEFIDNEIYQKESSLKEILIFSAKTENSLKENISVLENHFSNNPDENLSDIAFTLQQGRKEFEWRQFVVASDLSDAVKKMKDAKNSGANKSRANLNDRFNLVFMFPGQGAQYVNMGKGLYENVEVFRNTIDQCSEILIPLLEIDIRTLLFPENNNEDSAKKLEQTVYTQPALFIIEYALAKLFLNYGIKPDFMIGHSVGDYVAACLADVFSLEDALFILSKRAKLMQQQKSGSMLSVRSSEDEIKKILDNDIAIAAINSPNLVVLSGETERIKSFSEKLNELKIENRILFTSHAYHSQMMEPAIEPFIKEFQNVKLNKPSAPFISSLTGTWITDEQATDPNFWAAQLRNTVRFSDGIKELQKKNNIIIIEIGPGRALTTMASQHKKESGKQVAITNLTQPNEDADDLTNVLNAVGKLWLTGYKIDWKHFHKNKRRRIHLPGYQFDRKSYWIEPPKKNPAIKNIESTSTDVVVQQTKKEKVKKVIQGEAMTRKEYIAGILKEILEELSGINKSELDETKTFLELGFDSLFMTQVSLAFQKKFDVKITLRQLLETAPSINAIADYIDGSLAQGKFEPPKQEIVIEEEIEIPVNEDIQENIAQPNTQEKNFNQDVFNSSSNVEKLIKEQLEIMKKQLELLSGGNINQQLQSQKIISSSEQPTVIKEQKSNSETFSKSKGEKKVFERFGPYKPIETKKGGALTEQQQKYLNKFIDEYTRKTPASKKMTQEHRAHYSDPRTVSGFLPIWKEMTYQIIVKESKGSKLIDVDGNEYIDVIMGFGQYLFGHNPDFLKEAIKEQLELGIEIGPQSPIAGEVAKLICEFTGLDRAAFCVTGSEAVLGAMRAARTVTGKDKIVFFAGDYHGIIDEVLIKTTLNGEQIRTMPIAPGIPRENVQNTIALEYGSEESLRIIEKLLPELAAVMVEPVQSRRPDIQPKEFLHKLREITEKANIPLIFDEVITGFRVSNGGAQEYFGVKADIATYGKIIGGGFPIGVIAGKKLYMDAFDGGYWQYGDDSIPEAGVTFFAGTFARHPVSLKGAWTVLNYLKKDNNKLQKDLNEKAANLVSELNEFMLQRNVPIKFLNFSSVLYYSYPKDLNYFSLLFYLLRHKGIHILEGFPFFLSSAHSDIDIKKIINAFEESVVELQDNGFFPAPLDGGNGFEHTVELNEIKSNQFPLADAQKEIWLASQISEASNCAFNESNNIELTGKLNFEAFKKAFNKLIQRHDALRTTFTSDGKYQLVHNEIDFTLDILDLTPLSESDKVKELNLLISNETKIPFNLEKGPLLRATLVKLDEEKYNLLLTAHHIICDGWSYDVMVRDLSKLYSAEVEGKQIDGGSPMQMKEYVEYLQKFRSSDDYKQQEKFWLEKLSGEIQDLELPIDKNRPSVRTFNGARLTEKINSELFSKVKSLCVDEKVTLFTSMLAFWGILLHKLSNQNDVITGIPAAGQQVVGADDLIGHCTNLLPIRFNFNSELTFKDFVKDVKSLVLDAYENQQVTYVDIISKLKLKRSPNRSPLLSTMFNIDPAIIGLKFAGLDCKMNVNPRVGFQFELAFNIVSYDNHCEIECDFNTDLFTEEKIKSIINYYKNIISQITDNREIQIKNVSALSSDEIENLIRILNGDN